MEKTTRRTGRSLGHLTVNPCPAFVALTGELLLHGQNVVMVKVTADMEAPSLQGRIMADVEKVWVKVQVCARVKALANAPAILLAECFAAQFGGRGDVDDIMSQRTIDELLHRQTVFLKEAKVLQVLSKVDLSTTPVININYVCDIY